jgi:MFS family permease
MSSSDSSSEAPPSDPKPLYFVAWLLCALFYLYQYATRSAPGVMQDQLTGAWGGNHIGAMISACYVAYAVTALAAGLLLDRYGAARTMPYAVALVGVGCLVFAQGSETAGMIGFILEGVGAVFAFIGSSYVAGRNLPLACTPCSRGSRIVLVCSAPLSAPSRSRWRSILRDLLG